MRDQLGERRQMEKLLLTIPEACQASAHGRSFLYELFRDRKIETVKVQKAPPSGGPVPQRLRRVAPGCGLRWCDVIKPKTPSRQTDVGNGGKSSAVSRPFHPAINDSTTATFKRVGLFTEALLLRTRALMDVRPEGPGYD